MINLQGSVEQLKLARLARDFAQKNLDAENKKYKLGTDINQNVILQNALAQAESNVVRYSRPGAAGRPQSYN